jgi:hypothetical protein
MHVVPGSRQDAQPECHIHLSRARRKLVHAKGSGPDRTEREPVTTPRTDVSREFPSPPERVRNVRYP